MYFYKFKVTFDEVENFERNIEILSSSNFELFHQTLYESIGLCGHELASFSICDAKWNKKQEITLIDMHDDSEAETPNYGEEEEFSTSSHLPKFTMKDAVLKDFITDPHQYIIYEYDFINPKVFYIELLKTLPAKENVVYPRCTLTEGIFLKQDELIAVKNSEDDFMHDFQNEMDEEDFDEFADAQIWEEPQEEFETF